MPLLWRQALVFFNHITGLARVAHDRLMVRHGLAVVHHPSPKPYAPERSSAKLVRSGLIGVLGCRALYDAVAGTHVVKQEIAERMNDFIA
jgi:hypothetical protein